jgi:tight adherence protein C
MTPWMWLLAAVLATGVALVVTSLPAFRMPSVAERVEPYLGLVARPSRLVGEPEAASPWPTVERLIRPLLTDVLRNMDRLLGGAGSVRVRLDLLGPEFTVERFRFEQLACGVIGAAAGMAVLALRGMSGAAPSLLPSLVLILLAFIGGVLVRDRVLSAVVSRRTARMRTEFPTVIELLTLAVGAGEGLTSALGRVSNVGRGAFVNEITRCLNDIRAGTGTVQAMQRLANRIQLPEVRRFVDALVVAIERGTPLVDVLQAQAVDAREASRRALIEAGGRKEIAMMVPVVFLVLPLSVVFALFPGFYGLSLGSP